MSNPPAGHTPPDRSLEQRLTALENANRIRTFRKRIKALLSIGAVGFEELYDLDDTQNMKVRDALLALPTVGPRKADRALRAAGCSASKTFAGMTDRQRADLAVTLPRFARTLGIHLATTTKENTR